MFRSKSWNFTILLSIAVLAMLTLLNVFVISGAKKARLPKPLCEGCNVVVLDIDVLRADAVDCSNNFDETPNICRFAQQSVYFANNTSLSDLTKTNYVSTITSLYPSSHGVWSEIHKFNHKPVTLAEVLKRNGYKTEYHGLVSDLIMVEDDFDLLSEDNCLLCDDKPTPSIFAGLTPKSHLFKYFYFDDLHFPYFPRDNKPVMDSKEAPHGLPVTYQQFMNNFESYVLDNPEQVFYKDFIEKNKNLFDDPEKNRDKIIEKYWEGVRTDEKVYIKNAWEPYKQSFLNFIDQNNPGDVDYIKNIYKITLARLDAKIGELLDGLDNSAISDNTVVILKTDHGEEFFEHGRLTHGNDLYQELIHTPLIFRVPGVKPVWVNGLTMDLDFMPTLLDILGVDIPSTAQGKSLVPMLVDAKARVRDYQIAQKGGDNHVASFRNGDWKLIMKLDTPSGLYDLSSDPGETKNLIEDNFAIAHELFSQYHSIVDLLPKYGPKESPLPVWIDEEKRQRLKDEGYF